ncbi:MAG TPA: hypothetical protein PKM34_08565 [Bacteroidales bacterium]|nr:hypothetical protein [Bacteroidales bacterium]HPM93542.1 hypothetical protein [Bacteroidales bacterium]
MKKIVLLFGLLFALQAAIMAQLTDQEVVVFNAHLNETFNLNVDGVTQEITFAVAADYNNGVTEAGGIVPGFTLISVEATGDWELEISAPDFTPGGGPNPGTGAIPINNLGVWCQATGTHQFGTEVTCAYQNAAAAMGLTNADQLLIGLGTTNAGDISDNAFTLHWLMGTMQGSMNTESMFNQLALGTLFSTGDFTTTATLTLTEIP